MDTNKAILQCPDCSGTIFFLTMRLIKGSNLVKWIPMIGKYCRNCGKWIKWEEQTLEVINKFNQELKNLELIYE